MFGRKQKQKSDTDDKIVNSSTSIEASIEVSIEASAEVSTEVSTENEEVQWVAMAKVGDSVAFTKLVEAYQRPIFNLCYRMLGDAAEAEDAAQEAFIRAFLKIHSYDEARKFSSWLFSIASHYCIDRLRQRRIQWVSWDDLPPWQEYPSDNKLQPEVAVIQVEASQEIHALLHTLPPDYRAAVILKYWHNLPYEEIAEALETSVSAIKSRLFRARKMMATTVSQQGENQVVPGNLALAKS